MQLTLGLRPRLLWVAPLALGLRRSLDPRLRIERHVTDLIEEQAAAVRQFEAPAPAPVATAASMPNSSASSKSAGDA